MSPRISSSLPIVSALVGMTTLAFSDAPATNAPPTAHLPAVTRHAMVPRPPLYRDTTVYAPLSLSWSASSDLNQVLSVYPHLVLPQRALLTTQTGVLLTDDSGKTWTDLPAASVDKVGAVNDIAYNPISPDTFYLGSATSGIWGTTDGGKTFKQVGSKAKGLAADTVTSLTVYPGDPSYQTLLAVHGDAGAGLSVSHDNGESWDVVNSDYHFRRVMGSEGNQSDLYLIGSSLKEPDIQSLYTCTTVGEFVLELVRDVVPTDLAYTPVALQKGSTVYLATSDSGLQRLDQIGRNSLSYDTKQLGTKDDTWASVNVAWGPSADATNVYLYDPAKLGLVVSSDDLATVQNDASGIPVGSIIKEGALLRTNANGTVFYAVANGALSIGREPDDVPDVTVNPAIIISDPAAAKKWKDLQTALQGFAVAKGSALAAAQALIQKAGDPGTLYHQHQLTVTARLPVKPTPPSSVTVDLSRYGGSPSTPLFDDGQHGDGAAGDGVYGGTFAFLPEQHRPNAADKDARSVWPGRVALGVRAAYPDGHFQGAVGVVAIYSQTVDITLWNRSPKSVSVVAAGTVAAQGAPNPAEIHNGSMAMKVDAKPGAWSVGVRIPRGQNDITSYEGISFWVRVSDGAPPPQLYLQIADRPEFSAPTTTPKLPLLEGKTLGADYIHVVVPISQLLAQSPGFQTNKLDQVIISGETTAPATLYIDGLQFLVHDDDAPANDAANQ